MQCTMLLLVVADSVSRLPLRSCRRWWQRQDNSDFIIPFDALRGGRYTTFVVCFASFERFFQSPVSSVKVTCLGQPSLDIFPGCLPIRTLVIPFFTHRSALRDTLFLTLFRHPVIPLPTTFLSIFIPFSSLNSFIFIPLSRLTVHICCALLPLTSPASL